MQYLNFLSYVAHYISLITIVYSLIIFFISRRLSIHLSFTYLCLAIFFLGLLPNKWLTGSPANIHNLLFFVNLQYVFFNIAMILLGLAFIRIGLHRRVIYACMFVFIVFLFMCILSIFFGIDLIVHPVGNTLSVTFFYEKIFSPFLVLAFFAVFGDLIFAMRKENPQNRKIIQTLVFGIFFLILFGVFDMIYFFMIGSKLELPKALFSFSSFGILVFNIYTLAFITEMIYHSIQKRKDIQFRIPQSENLKKDPPCDQNLTLFARVTEAITEQALYSDPDLDLISLSRQLGIPRNEISRAVNEGSGEHFNCFLNRFRINALKRLLENRENDDTSILTLAYKVGFNSKATLNRVFKSMEGISPQEYRKLHSC